jgi:alcohol dehydrogenase YqhD (iron-dependent ADH family)
LGHELSGRFDVTHGASLTAVWGAWANYVYQDDIPRFAQFAAKIWGITEGTEEERAKAGIEATIAYFKEIGMPVNFTELGIGVQSDDVLEALADSCTAGGTKVVANFHPIDKQTAIAIYQLANQ